MHLRFLIDCEAGELIWNTTSCGINPIEDFCTAYFGIGMNCGSESDSPSIERPHGSLNEVPKDGRLQLVDFFVLGEVARF